MPKSLVSSVKHLMIDCNTNQLVSETFHDTNFIVDDMKISQSRSTLATNGTSPIEKMMKSEAVKLIRYIALCLQSRALLLTALFLVNLQYSQQRNWEHQQCKIREYIDASLDFCKHGWVNAIFPHHLCVPGPRYRNTCKHLDLNKTMTSALYLLVVKGRNAYQTHCNSERSHKACHGPYHWRAKNPCPTMKSVNDRHPESSHLPTSLPNNRAAC